MNSKKPFAGRKFYLDLKFYRHQDVLVKDLKKLGGKVECFLSKDVTHVITDRSTLKPKTDSWSPLTPNSHVSVGSPLHGYDSSFSLLDTSVQDKSFANEGRMQSLSRGLALVQKAKQNKQGTTDILDVCIQWQIKVLHLQKILSYISKTKEVLHLKKEDSKKALVKTNCDIQKLVPPFIKIEDIKCKYRPFHKTFRSWKDSIDTSLFCSVSKLLKQVQVKCKSSKENVSPYAQSQGNILHHTVQSLYSQHLNQNYTSAASYGSPHLNTLNSSRQPFRELQLPTKKSGVCKDFKHPKTDEKKKTVKKRYCEICSCTYYNINEHLSTENHRKFLNNPDNYAELKEFISSISDVNSFMKKNLELKGSEEQGTLKSVTKEKNSFTYLNNDDDYVSASCSTEILSNSFPFLEDSADSLKYKMNISKSEFDSSKLEILPTNFKNVCGESALLNSLNHQNTPAALDCTYKSLKALSDLNRVECEAGISLTGADNATQVCNESKCENTECSPEINISKKAVENISRSFGIPVNIAANTAELQQEHAVENTNDSLLDNNFLNINGCIVRKFPFTNFGFDHPVYLGNDYDCSASKEIAPDKNFVEKFAKYSTVDRNADDACSSLCSTSECKENCNLCENADGQKFSDPLDLTTGKSETNYGSSATELGSSNVLDLSPNRNEIDICKSNLIAVQ